MDGLTIQVRNAFSELPRVATLVETWMSGQPSDVIFAANLVIEELLTNIFSVGSAHEIQVRLAITNGTLAIAVSDDGCAFNPLEHPAPDTNNPAKDREPGGLGIHLSRKMTDSFSYQRVDGANVVTLTKAL